MINYGKAARLRGGDLINELYGKKDKESHFVWVVAQIEQQIASGLLSDSEKQIFPLMRDYYMARARKLGLVSL